MKEEGKELTVISDEFEALLCLVASTAQVSTSERECSVDTYRERERENRGIEHGCNENMGVKIYSGRSFEV